MAMRRIDSKYFIQDGTIRRLTTGKEIPADEPLFLLRGRDKLAAQALRDYMWRCKQAGCSGAHLQGVEAELDKFTEYARKNAAAMRLPGSTKNGKGVTS